MPEFFCKLFDPADAAAPFPGTPSAAGTRPWRCAPIGRDNQNAVTIAGAQAACGQVFWFLHADSAIPRDGLKAIRAALAKPDAAGGYFRIRLPDTHLIYRLTDSFAHYAGLGLQVRCGDHGLFCRQSLFFQSGGYPEVPLMEDVEFYRKLHGLGRVRAVQHRLTTSTRRYEQFGRISCYIALRPARAALRRAGSVTHPGRNLRPHVDRAPLIPQHRG